MNSCVESKKTHQNNILSTKENQTQKSKTSIFQFPHLWLGVLALFVYVGVEVIAGDTII